MIMSVNTIMKKLSEIELESHEVKLKTVQDVIKQMDKAESLLEAKGTKKTKAKDAMLSYSAAAKDAFYAFDAVVTQYDELVKAAKFLGIDPPTELKGKVDRAKVQANMNKAEFNAVETGRKAFN